MATDQILLSSADVYCDRCSTFQIFLLVKLVSENEDEINGIYAKNGWNPDIVKQVYIDGSPTTEEYGKDHKDKWTDNIEDLRMNQFNLLWEQHSDNNQSLKELPKITVTGRKWQWHRWLDSSGSTLDLIMISDNIHSWKSISVHFHNDMKEISWLPDCLIFHNYEIRFVHYIRTLIWNWMSNVEIVIL